MVSYRFLLDLAIILLSTKIFGLITRRVNMPQVVGALIAGLILGPAMLNILQETDFITQLSELGVIVLMFIAGLETNISELKNCGKASAMIAILGVIVPLVVGAGLGFVFAPDENFLEHVFMGAILTATSVSITVETLKEMGKLNTKVANTILGAAIIDDILGIILLTFVSSFADPSVKVGLMLFKIVLFFVFAAIVGIVFHKVFDTWFKHATKDLRRYVIAGFVFCLVLSFIAEEFFGVADITGAFLAGLILSSTKESGYITARLETMSYLLLSPVFFASVGINATLPPMSFSIVIFSILLIVFAILTKICGCYFGAKLSKFTNRQALQIGSGMVSRGEVALIMANKGQNLGILNATFVGPIILMIVVTTIIAPMFLKLSFRPSKKGEIDE